MSRKLTDIGTLSGTGSSGTKVLVQSGGTAGWADRDDVVSDLIEATEAATEALNAAAASGTTVAQTYAEELYAYGVEWDVTDSDPDVTRIGNTSYHKTLPVQSLMKGCLLADDGTVNAYLGASDWTSYDRSGDSGQVMVEIPQHYRKFVTDGDTRQVWISLVAIEGYHKVPKMYISAYEAALDRTNLKLCSIVNEDEQYIGGGGSSDESSYAADDYTLCGLPATNVSLTNYRTYARNRGSYGLNGAGWNCYTYQAHKALYWLFVIEYATRNSQKTYNSELTSDGYRQGGLGSGVTTINGTYWSSWNNYNPFIPCGYTDSLGNGTGVVSFDMPSGYLEAASLSSLAVSVPRYRGIENPFGHVWKWCDGALIYGEDNQLYTVNEATGEYDPSLFSSTSYASYQYQGAFSTNSSVYVTDILFGEYGEIAATDTGGSASTYYCDYTYTNAGTTIRAFRVGGYAYLGTIAGLACLNSHNAPSHAYRFIGSRLCFYAE